MTIQDIYDVIDQEIAPFSLAEAWDNSGLLAGDPRARVERALICLDITQETVDEALQQDAQLLISHHPVIFRPMKHLLSGSPIYALARAGLGAVCAHTNLDAAPGGVNDCLAQTLELLEVTPLSEPPTRMGLLSREMTARQLAQYVRQCLGLRGDVRYVDGGLPIQRVAVCGGAGGSFAALAHCAGAQALITGEVKHDVLLECAAMGLTVIDAGHGDTERMVLAPLAQRLGKLCAGVCFTVSRQESPVQYA